MKRKITQAKHMIKRTKRKIALGMATLLTAMAILPQVTAFRAEAGIGDTIVLTSAHGNYAGGKLYCIDKNPYHQWGVADDGDTYERHSPHALELPLNEKQLDYVFWAMLSLKASQGDQKANDVIKKIREGAILQGKTPITNFVTEEDLKAVAHDAGYRAKYPWLETVASNSEEYMKMAGLIGESGSSGSTVGGKTVPNVISSSTTPGTAYQVDMNTLTIQFDTGSEDFIQTVPILFSNDNGSTWDPTSSDGWTYQKTSNSIVFTNPNPTPPKALVKFDVSGTAYASGSGTFSSKEDVIENCLIVYECIACSGNHASNAPSTLEPWLHQRLINIEISNVPVTYYAALAGDPTPLPAQGGFTFEAFRHAEDFTATYNVQLYKYDYETGKPLEDARFGLYERFDDQDEVDTVADGYEALYEGGGDFAGGYLDALVLWDGFRNVGSITTDKNGYGSQTIEHEYHYDKTFCNGHPAPEFVAVPEPEEDEETGDILNEGEIDAAKEQNKALAEAWISCFDDCEAKADEIPGVHFHWLLDDVDQGEIESIASSGGDEGSTPNAGTTTGADGETSYEESGCKSDCESTYDKFIAMRYSYVFEEYKARDGYILHDIHSDDLPIEVITTDSSENGANASFGDGYGKNESLGTSLRARKYTERTVTAEAESESSSVFSLLRRSGKETGSSNGAFLTPWTNPIIACGIVEYMVEMSQEASPAEAEKDTMATAPEADEEDETDSFELIVEDEAGEKSDFSTDILQESEADIAAPLPTLSEESEAEEDETQENISIEDESIVETEEEESEEAVGESEQEKPVNEEESEQEEETTEVEELEVSISSHKTYRALSPLLIENFVFIDEDEIFSDIEEDSSGSRTATDSNVTATPAEIPFTWTSRSSYAQPMSLTGARAGDGESAFGPAYEAALASDSVGDEIEPGDDGNYSHCNDADGEDDAWRVYDHRTEGEFHINKRDLDLQSGEDADYNSYGDAQGDATLEGAVYGLFAADDIIHPDGKTGVVYKANNLVAVATTDKNGDASFIVNTEAPGKTYDYAKGAIVNTDDGWNANAPKNLYVKDISYDDYTEDGEYERTYVSNESNNGNCWIGRPLLMGDYYVKELSRSEGYELSIGNKFHGLTNNGQDLEVKAPAVGNGYAHVVTQMYGEEQTGEGGAMPNEIFFSVESEDTDNGTYDLVVTNLPDGTKLYRKDVGTKEITVTVGTGTYNAVETGNYVVAESDYQYPKYNTDGTMMTVETPINYVASFFLQVPGKEINAATVTSVMQTAEGTMTEDENTAKLAAAFTLDDQYYVKGKVETALRRNGKQTPRSKKTDGSYDYSSIYVGVYDNGVRKGETDQYGISGVAPGQPASETVYGSAVQTISVPKTTATGAALTVGSAITTLMNYYNTNSYLSYGGLHNVDETTDAFLFTVYASVSGKPSDFMVVGTDAETDSIIYHAVNYLPDDASESPRMVYVPYSNNEDINAFGTYEDYSDYQSGSSIVCSATLVTDAIIDGSGVISSKSKTENVYYKTGETPLDASGNPIKEVIYEEVTTTETKEIEDVTWVEIPATKSSDGKYVVSVDATFTDSYGVGQSNQGNLQVLEFKAVVPEESVVLTADDVEKLGAGYVVGKPMNGASYYTVVKNARAKAYLDYSNLSLVGDDTYVQMASLVYPGEKQVYQDAETRKTAVGVNERIIRQKIKIVKDIETTPDGSYAHNTATDSGHQDSFTLGSGAKGNAASSLPNFRFKLYLKSNLERLYRNEAGEIAWVDRNGNEVEISDYQDSYPVMAPYSSVQKLYTEVPHKADSVTAGALNNNLWSEAVTANDTLYSYENGKIKSEQNAGYTRLLETTTSVMEDGAGKTREVTSLNYKKFFDAVEVANEDKWNSAGNNSSFKPLAWIREFIFGTLGGETEDPVDHNSDEISNVINTGTEAEENAKRSDNVRQFAITWYLEGEVEKLVEDNGLSETQPVDGSEKYQDEIYDKALYAAILKAENYLKPFFSYDLDEIYAIEWDNDSTGGKDKDLTTLSADTYFDVEGNGQETSRDGYYYGVSTYLPYGTYVAVEQQPGDGSLDDFENQHYKTDMPKEILVPSVYEAGGNHTSPEKLNKFYQYTAADTPEKLAAKYQIRMNEEWSDEHTDDLRNYIIRGHNHDGDFEVYKYGLDADKLASSITYAGAAYSYKGFAITQEEFDPYKDIYETENPVSDYKMNQTVEKYYRYGSVSEQAGLADDVIYQHGENTDDNNPSGFFFKDAVRTITGVLTGYDGRYFSALVPMTVTEPAESDTYNSSAFTGYADGKYRNTFYTAKLRIEKLDSETGENLLHDEAVFAIYAAERDTSAGSEGEVLFYENDTEVTATKEFLEAMGAKNITPADLTALIPSTFPWKAPYTGLYKGVIPSGTPKCSEKEQILMLDESGNETGTFKAFTTQTDTSKLGVPENQNVGYLVTPQPLGAGVYVLCELSAPAGYAKSKPIAVEVYSDAVTYYLNGKKDNRVAAAVYEEDVTLVSDNGSAIVNPDGTKPNGNKPQDVGDVARIYVNNTPLRLEVSKVKQEEKEILYELNGRKEGSIAKLDSLYGLENMVLAYNASGTFLGYGWPKGYLESLKAKQEAGEQIDLLYEDSVFTGRAVLHVVPNTADDTNRYLPGAKLTLYEAIEVVPNGDTEDVAYAGVNVVRDSFSNVTRMYVEKGYAGEKTLFVKDKDVVKDADHNYERYTYDDAINDTGSGTWILETVQREDTDILYYDLGGLSVFTKVEGKLYGYDADGNLKKTKDGNSIYAMKGGSPFLEIVCPSYEDLSYSNVDHLFDKVPVGTEFYHLDLEGNRDACVDPYTGMAYVVEEDTGKVLVWPVKISKDKYGNTIAKEKIKTSRIATINEDTENEYVTGTYDGVELKKEVNPVLNSYGLPIYYQRTDETYLKGMAIYDRDKDYVRYKYNDLLDAFNQAAWTVNRRLSLLNIGTDPKTASDDKPLFHRAGENYVIENTWITGENTPNNPFDESDVTNGQVDVLKRIHKGLYIMEEVSAPSGYAKSMPVGLTVEESEDVQNVRMTDRPISVYIEKIDAPDDYEKLVLDNHGIISQKEIRIEGAGSYTFDSVKGAKLALFAAKRVATSDLENHPKGYYLVKMSETPFTYKALSNDNTKEDVTAEWTVGEAPKYLEGIPAGYYILEETSTLPGYIPASMEIEIDAKADLQTFTLPNDHIKVEFLKYEKFGSANLPLANEHAAGLTLYPAKRDAEGLVMLDSDGNPLYEEGAPVTSWTTDDCSAYTEGEDSFVEQFKTLYESYLSGFAELTWKGNVATKVTSATTDKEESSRQLWDLGNGKQVLVHVSRNRLGDGSVGYDYDFKFNYKTEGTLISYDTVSGRHRIDYLPLTDEVNRKGYYVLVETDVPDGYHKADPVLIVVEETGDIQLFGMENEAKSLNISKVGKETATTSGVLLKGAELALYRADSEGNLDLDRSYEVERWVSGKEGSYTEADKAKGLIPEGFAPGDLKPHQIKPIAYGTYYIVETNAPKGYETMVPVKVTVTADSEEYITVENIVKKGILRIEKVDEVKPDEKLSGAVFEVTNKETGDTYTLTTGDSGKAETVPLVTGKPGENGVWEPYTFEVKEIVPPEGYQLNLTTFKVKFEGDSTVDTLVYELTVPDEKTKIRISKLDFDKKLFLSGACLAVYETVIENGSYIADGAALEEWTSRGSSHVIEGKLIAGHTYILKEISAPAGYTKAEPYLFTISDDGRRINSVTDNLEIVALETTDSLIDAVESVTIQSRKALKTELTLTDLETGEAIILLPGHANEITSADGVTEGRLYELKEVVTYSDGSTYTGSKSTFRLVYGDDGSYPISIRSLEKTSLCLENETGEVIDSWDVENSSGAGYVHVITNPEYEDSNAIRVSSANGKYGAAVKPGSILWYEVVYENGGKETTDMEISVVLDPQLMFMPANSTEGAKVVGDICKWHVSNVRPGESGTLLVVASIDNDASGSIETTATIAGKDYQVLNPLGCDGTVTIVSTVSGSAAEELKGTEITYTVHMKDESGNPILGRVSYDGSKTGALKDGETITLNGGEFVVLSGLVWGSGFEVTAEIPEGISVSEQGTSGFTSKAGNTALFALHKNDPSVRELLKKGETYRLIETTVFDTGAEETNVILFSLNEHASVDGIGMTDKPTHVVIRKTDIGGEELPGAHIVVKDKDGNVVDEWISTDEPHEIVGELTPGETYVMIEEGAPDGYAYAEEIEFTVSEDGAVDRVEMVDKPTHVELTKYDVTDGKELPGAHLEVRDKDGKVIDSWISTDEPHKIIGELIAGETYYFVEISAPDGYWVEERISFTVSLDGKIDKVEMYDVPTKVEFEKRALERDGVTDAGFLSGARLQVKDLSGNVVADWYTEDAAKVLVGVLNAGETYELHEVEAPEGYKKAEMVTFTVSTDKTVKLVKMYDELLPRPSGDHGGGGSSSPNLVIHKYDGVTLESLSGAEFTIYRENGSVYATIRTDETGRAKVVKPVPGKYTYVETKAPEGYPENSQVYHFEIKSYTDRSLTLAVENQMRDRVVVKKADLLTGELLAGAEFTVYAPDGTACYVGITGPDGTASFYPTVAGLYKIVETKAPEGYELRETPITFVVNEDLSVTGDTTIRNVKLTEEIGKIDAWYGSGITLGGDATTERPGKWISGVPKLGENRDSKKLPIGVIVLTITLCFGTGVVLVGRRKKADETEY